MSIARARRLRKTMTPDEVCFWALARQWRAQGLHFRRQAPFGPYVLDFVCHGARMVVELDGSGHGEPAQARHDARRDAVLEHHGYRVIRLWNRMVTEDQIAVFDWVYQTACERQAALQTR